MLLLGFVVFDVPEFMTGIRWQLSRVVYAARGLCYQNLWRRQIFTVISGPRGGPACFKLGAQHKKLQAVRQCTSHAKSVKCRLEVSWTFGPQLASVQTGDMGNRCSGTWVTHFCHGGS